MNGRSLKSLVTLFILVLGLLACGNETNNPIEPEDPKDPDETLDYLPEVRKQRLSKGLNLAHWFAQQKNNTLTSSYITMRFKDADFDFIKDAGFTFVRISIDERIAYSSPNSVNTKYLDLLDSYIQGFIDDGIGVLVDLHPTDSFKSKVISDSEFANNIRLFWGKFAKHLSKFDPDYVFFEVMNEPMANQAKTWNEIQEKWVPEIRANAPKHTIVVDGNLRITTDNWDDVAALMSINPFEDKNIVYNLHIYDPFEFTHQGATWGWSTAQYLSGLKYPMDEANCLDIKNKHSDKQDVGWAMDNYIKQDWDKDRIKEVLLPLQSWAKEHDIFITVNEFGAYYPSIGNGKAQYIKDIRELFEELDLGWAIWEYDEGYGIISKNNGVINFSEGIEDALGL